MIDALDKAKQQIDEMKIPLTTISILTGLSVTDLSGIFTRQRPCGSVKEIKISKAVRMLDELTRAIAPIPINYSRGVILKEILDQRELGDLSPVVITPQTVLGDTSPELAVLLEMSQRRLDRGEVCQKG